MGFPFEWIGVTVISLSLVVWIIRGLLWTGRGGGRMEIDGRWFQFPSWVITEIEGLMLEFESDAVRAATDQATVLQKLAGKVAKASGGKRKRLLEEMETEQVRYDNLQKEAERAWKSAGRRWLISDRGQDWLQKNGLRFP